MAEYVIFNKIFLLVNFFFKFFFNILKKNIFISILICFYLNWVNVIVICNPGSIEIFSELKPLVVDNTTYLCTKNVKLSNLIHSKGFFTNFWNINSLNCNLYKFKNLNGSFYNKRNPFSHPHIIVYVDYFNQLYWNFQYTHTPTPQISHLFEFFSSVDFNNKIKDNYISVNLRAYHFNDVLLNFYKPVIYMDKNELNAKILKLIIKNNIQPNYLCTNFNNINWDNINLYN